MLRAIVLFAAIVVLQPVSTALASQVVLDEVKVTSVANLTTVNIHFGLPLEYLKHFPRSFGEILQIQLKLDVTGERELRKEVREGGELLAADGRKSVLVYMTYEEGVPGGPYLTLRFSHPVRFEVLPGPDSTSLTVKIIDETVGSEKAEEKEAALDADTMMAKARQAITFGNNKGAIELLRKIMRMPRSAHTQEANELLGLALERDQQIPRAKYEYKKYLKRYPEGDGANRVRQRLAALRELRVKPKRRLREAAKAKRRAQFTTFGRLTQSYSEYYVDRELEGDAEAQEQELQQKLLATHFSVKGRYRGEDRTIQGVFTASHTYDYLAGKEGREDDDKQDRDIRHAYVEVDDELYGYSGRLGRQSSRNGGVFGTFDGVIAGYRFRPKWLVSLMAGKPVFRTYTDVELPEKVFYGIKADIESDNKELNSNLFFVQQDVDGIADRQAVGADLRFARRGLSVFALVDFDTLYNDLSLFNLRVGWNYTPANKLNFSYNRRHLLMTSNALLGMRVTTIDDLLDFIPESEIQRLAEERTRVDETLTIGNSYQINKDQQLNVDVTLLQSTGIENGIDPTTGDILYGYDATGKQYIYSLQWISSNTFIERDLYVLGLRRSDFYSYADTSLFVNARVPLFEKWRPGFRLNISRRDSQTYGEKTTISPLVQLNYRLTKVISFDAEFGADFVENANPDDPDEVRKRIRIAYNVTF